MHHRSQFPSIRCFEAARSRRQGGLAVRTFHCSSTLMMTEVWRLAGSSWSSTSTLSIYDELPLTIFTEVASHLPSVLLRSSRCRLLRRIRRNGTVQTAGLLSGKSISPYPGSSEMTPARYTPNTPYHFYPINQDHFRATCTIVKV